MLKSIKTSQKFRGIGNGKVKSNSVVKVLREQVLRDIPRLNKDINVKVQSYEECQAASVENVGNIRSR